MLQGKAGDSMGAIDNSNAAGFPLFMFVDENIFKKETFLGKRSRWREIFARTLSVVCINPFVSMLL